MNTVTELMSGAARKRAYVAFAVVSGLIGASLAGFSAIAVTAPPALIFASAFFNFLGTAFGFVAAGNTTTTSAQPDSIDVTAALSEVDSQIQAEEAPVGDVDDPTGALTDSE